MSDRLIIMEIYIESILVQVEYHKMPFQYARTLHKLCMYYDLVDCKILATAVIVNNTAWLYRMVNWVSSLDSFFLTTS